MENPNLIFFSDKGLTSTSANHIANLAKECVHSIEQTLQGIQFYSRSVSLIGQREKSLLEEGATNEVVSQVSSMLEQVSNAKALIAWLREAIKAKETLISEVTNMSFEEWAEKFKVVVPVMPVKRNALTTEMAMAKRSIKERNRIYTLQAQAAVLGKYIHPDGHFANERARLQEVLNSPHSVQENGRDTLIYDYTPSCDAQVVESVFFELQNQHRSIQAELNGYMHAIDEEVRADKLKCMAEYNTELGAYNSKMQDLNNRFEEYKVDTAGRMSNLYKICIPHDLEATYNMINSLGK